MQPSWNIQHVDGKAMFCVPFLLQQALQQKVEFFVWIEVQNDPNK